jgi:pSer/pThr/pTyr-binding forkhead associated (FHA) protein
MADQVLLLTGTAGLVAGERYLLAEVADVVLGRSRSCDVSLRRCGGYLKAPAATRDQDHDFNTVSRRHLRIQVGLGRMTLTDSSTNGSFLNDEQVRQPLTVDIGVATWTIRLGTRETLTLQRVPAHDQRALGLAVLSGGGQIDHGD